MLYRQYQVEKSAALGLLVPQSLGLEVRAFDGQDPSLDLGLAYRTTSLKWWECMATLPPKFLVLSAGNAKASDRGSSGSSSTCEVEGAVARISRPLMNLPPRNHARIEMGLISEPSGGGSSSYRSDSITSPPPTESRVEEWEIRQQGFKRHYAFYPSTTKSQQQSAETQPPDATSTFTWKGSRSILSTIHPTTQPEGHYRHHHGNLKLLAPSGAVLAAWQQQRDRRVLGTLHVFDAAVGMLPMDVLVATCLYVVVVERILWTTFVGG